MIAAWMLYTMAVGFLLYAAAMGAEYVTRALRVPARFVWLFRHDDDDRARRARAVEQRASRAAGAAPAEQRTADSTRKPLVLSPEPSTSAGSVSRRPTSEGRTSCRTNDSREIARPIQLDWTCCRRCGVANRRACSRPVEQGADHRVDCVVSARYVLASHVVPSTAPAGGRTHHRDDRQSHGACVSGRGSGAPRDSANSNRPAALGARAAIGGAGDHRRSRAATRRPRSTPRWCARGLVHRRTSAVERGFVDAPGATASRGGGRPRPTGSSGKWSDVRRARPKLARRDVRADERIGAARGVCGARLEPRAPHSAHHVTPPIVLGRGRRIGHRRHCVRDRRVEDGRADPHGSGGCQRDRNPARARPSDDSSADALCRAVTHRSHPEVRCCGASLRGTADDSSVRAISGTIDGDLQADRHHRA